MKKYLIGALVTTFFLGAGYAYAARVVTVPDDIKVVDRLQITSLSAVFKVYDSSTNVVCYLYTESGISCLKNI